MNKIEVEPKVIACLDGDLNQPVIVIDEHSENSHMVAVVRLANGEIRVVDARRIICQEVE